MGFNEMVHAFIAAKFYVYLTERFGERGKSAFLHATRTYAEQRGRRMAQRAIRDGQPLNFETYCRYGEWASTEEMQAMGLQNQAKVRSLSPDYEVHIFVCPWHEQFRRMGLPEAGELYCRDLDASICRGFNPEIDYKTLQTLHDHDRCVQVVRDANLKKGLPSKDPANMKSFEYHCAHSYWTYSETATAIFGAAGQQAAAQVLKDFAQEYGEQLADTLVGYRDVDFDAAR